MAEPAERLRMTYAEYLALEESSTEKHEYLRGEVWSVRAMSGGTIEHARLEARLALAFGTALAGRPCETYGSDLRIRVAETEFTAYPDLSIVCGPAETAADDPHAVTNPAVLVEILSPGSEAYDCGEKFAHYRRIASLRAYVLVSQAAQRIEVFHRVGDGRWELTEAGPGEKLRIHAVEVALDVDAVYAVAA